MLSYVLGTRSVLVTKKRCFSSSVTLNMPFRFFLEPCGDDIVHYSSFPPAFFFPSFSALISFLPPFILLSFVPFLPSLLPSKKNTSGAYPERARVPAADGAVTLSWSVLSNAEDK